MIRPAIRHIFYSMSLESTDPELMMSAFDSLYNFVFNVVEAMCLYSHGSASLMEGIYGYRRMRLNPEEGSNENNDNEKSNHYLSITANQKALSMLYFIVMPRILSILKIIRDFTQYLEQRDERIDEENSREDFSNSSVIVRLLKKLLRGVQTLQRKIFKYGVKAVSTILPHLLAFESMASTLFYILYLLKLTPYHHPLFAVLNMELVKDRHQMSTTSAALSTMPAPASSSQPIATSVQSNRSWHLTAVLGIMFTLRAVDWMVNSDHTSEHINNRLGLVGKPPPPPKALKVARGGVIPLQDRRLCSLCGKIRTNPCAASSGYVFCYLCILNHVRDHGVCPVTHLPCLEKDLVRLFETTV